MNVKRIFPMKINFLIKNISDFIFQKKYEVYREDEKSICFFLDAATYNNLGDQAIALAMECFLDDIFGSKYVRVINESDLVKYLSSLKKQIRSNDIIVLSGGGNMGDLYPRYESLRRLIINSFPNNKIIIFPQTIDYSKDNYGRGEFEKSKRVYNSHKSLYICAREQKSFEIMKRHYKKVVLVPDIVLYLKGRINSPTASKKEVGFCLRHDKESLLDRAEEKEIREAFSNTGCKIHTLTTMSNVDNIEWSLKSRSKEVLGKIEEFKKCTLIFTDRLHGMIFCILAGRPCLFSDNKNCKVSGVREMLLKYDVDLGAVGDIKDIQSFKEVYCGNKVKEIEFHINENLLYKELKKVLVD